jgi:hypothetical protein
LMAEMNESEQSAFKYNEAWHLPYDSQIWESPKHPSVT